MDKEREFKDWELSEIIKYRDDTKNELEAHQIECEMEANLIKELNKEIRIKCKEEGKNEGINK